MTTRNLAGARAAAKFFVDIVSDAIQAENGQDTVFQEAMHAALSSEFHAEQMEPYIKAAYDGDEIASTGLKHAIIGFIECGMPIPPALRKFAAEVIAHSTHPKRKPGVKKHKNYQRDAWIKRAVTAAMEHGVERTRNESTEAESACSIVCDELAKAGIVVSEKSIERISSDIV